MLFKQTSTWDDFDKFLRGTAGLIFDSNTITNIFALKVN